MGAAAAVRLRLEDVASPVVARLAARARDRMVVAHPLPFLRLFAGVEDEDGRKARIEGVRLDVQDGVPNLILDVVYEQDALAEPFGPARRDSDTLPGFVPEGIEETRPRRDPTVPFEFQRDAPRFVVAISDPPPAPVVPSFWSRVWMHVALWARAMEIFVDRMIAQHAAARSR